jgi:hypothetical protein
MVARELVELRVFHQIHVRLRQHMMMRDER